MEELLNEFNKSLNDLENIDMKFYDDDKAIILLNAPSKSLEHFRGAMIFIKEGSTSLDTLRINELQEIDKAG